MQIHHRDGAVRVHVQRTAPVPVLRAATPVTLPSTMGGHVPLQIGPDGRAGMPRKASSREARLRLRPSRQRGSLPLRGEALLVQPFRRRYVCGEASCVCRFQIENQLVRALVRSRDAGRGQVCLRDLPMNGGVSGELRSEHVGPVPRVGVHSLRSGQGRRPARRSVFTGMTWQNRLGADADEKHPDDAADEQLFHRVRLLRLSPADVLPRPSPHPGGAWSSRVNSSPALS